MKHELTSKLIKKINQSKQRADKKVVKMSNDPELLKKLIDDDELEDVELQKQRSPLIVKGISIDTSSRKNKKPVRRGNFRCCCKCMVITIAIFILLVVLALGYAYSKLNNFVEDFTIETDSPQKFPIVEMSETKLEKIKDRVQEFIAEVDHGKKEIEDLVLTQDEINGFAGHSDFLRGNYMITFHKDRIVEEFSLPMDILGYNDRYFVGNDYFALKSDGQKNLLEMKLETEATHEDLFDGPLYFMQLQYLMTKNKEDEGENLLQMFVERGTFFGQDVPEDYIDQHENVMDFLYDLGDYDENLYMISGIESVSIEEGKVVVKARQNENN